tara:strand:+ start:682 stop:936 length:255 start_codon:yes stop_codon:yes gene_type:complete
MKNLIKYVFLAVASCLWSCSTTPIIGNKQKPFIVVKIESIDDNYCNYYGDRKARYGASVISAYPKIVLPKGLKNVGDTVRVNCD